MSVSIHFHIFIFFFRGSISGERLAGFDRPRVGRAARPEATVCEQTGLSKGTAQRALHSLPKNPCGPISARAISIEYVSQPSPESQLPCVGVSVP